MNRYAVRLVIASQGLLPVSSPKYNFREVVKQCVLLEDHLFQLQKRCPDCIVKHFLTIEALLEEAVTLDQKALYSSFVEEKVHQVRVLQRAWLDGLPEASIAQVLRKLRKSLQPYVFDLRTATKSHTEKEDEEVDKLIKKSPKKKPPRKDKRKEKVDVEKDPDISDLGAEGDRDLSLNYKRVAWLYLQAKENPVKRKSGDVWKSESGKWKAKNQKGETRSFEDKDKAQQFASGRGESKSDSSVDEDFTGPYPEEDDITEEIDTDESNEDPPDPKAKRPDPHSGLPEGNDESDESDTSSDKQENKSQNDPNKAPPDQVLKDPKPQKQDVSVPQDLGDSLSKAVEGIKNNVESLAEYAQSYDETLAAIKQNGFQLSPEEAKKAIEEAENISLEDSNPKELGALVARAEYAKRVTMNPLMVGGKPVSDSSRTEPLSESERSERMKASLAQAQTMDPKGRQKMYDDLKSALDSAEEGSPRHNELTAIAQGIQMASILASEDDDEFPGEPKPPKTFRKMVRMMASLDGGIDLLTAPADQFSSKKVLDAFKESSKGLTDEEFVELMKNSGSSAADFVDLSDDPVMNEHIRELSLDVFFDEATIIPELMREFKPEITTEQIQLDIQGSKQNAEDILRNLEEDVEVGIFDSDRIRLDRLQNVLDDYGEGDDVFGPMHANILSAVQNEDISQLDTKTDPPLAGPINPGG